MKNKTIFLTLILFIIQSINCILCNIIVEDISPIEYEPYYDVFSFKMELNEVPKEFQTKSFIFNLKELNSENKNFSSFCYLLDEKELKKVVESKNQTEDLSYTCFMETDGLSNKTIEMDITDIIIYDKENINFDTIGGRNFTFTFPESTSHSSSTHSMPSSEYAPMRACIERTFMLL